MRPVGNPPRGMIIGRKRASALAGILRISGYVVVSMLVVSRLRPVDRRPRNLPGATQLLKSPLAW